MTDDQVISIVKVIIETYPIEWTEKEIESEIRFHLDYQPNIAVYIDPKYKDFGIRSARVLIIAPSNDVLVIEPKWMHSPI